ncbi:hypothetical protein Tco_0718684 [Tanacetum coccineum]
MKADLKEEMKSDLKEEMREELKEEMREELKEEIRAEIQDMLVDYGIKSRVTRQTKTKQGPLNFYVRENLWFRFPFMMLKIRMLLFLSDLLVI